MVVDEQPVGFAMQDDMARHPALVWGLGMKAAGEEQALTRERSPGLK